MKVFFDTNVYVAEALLGRGAQRMLAVTRRAKWKVYSSQYVLDELRHVLVDDLNFGNRLANLAQRRIRLRSMLVKPRSTARVVKDPKDSPILQAALSCGADYLITNDLHLLELNPFESCRIVSMDDFHTILRDRGLLK